MRLCIWERVYLAGYMLSAIMSLPPLSVKQIQKFEPRKEWFLRNLDGLHGVGHEARVLIWTQLIALMEQEEGFAVDAAVLGWAAALHDTRRWNDGIDPQHGARAAAFIEANPDILPPGVPVDRVAYLCRWHTPSDMAAPELTPELKVFKDADALDRCRIGDLDVSYLRTKAALRLVQVAGRLWKATQDYGDDEEFLFAHVVRIAAAQQILNDT